MLSSLMRPRKVRRRVDRSPFSSPTTGSPEDIRRGQTNPYESNHSEDDEGEEDQDAGTAHDERTVDEDDEDEPLLPIFSAAHLDALPVYNITHAIRMLIIPKCETTLTWDQLRSPQISQFLVKPIQVQIRANHFNRATLLALIANALQFKKESETNLGMAGTNKTRALLAELLAMRLLREYSTRELIDALSYDFDPLKGIEESGPHLTSRNNGRTRLARISTVEIAIRASAKKFLAHPLVVQQLEAIWAGSIVFHSAADNLHRKPQTPDRQQRMQKTRGYGTIHDQSATPKPIPPPSRPVAEEYVRRSVTLYDPRDASLFKLSRLRVPRYRQLFSTLSFAVMLVLFLIVLSDRSRTITPLEIVFWLYSAGYMLDEVVGFTEQGFGLYIISVWNAFDLGILFLFFVYYVLRLYGLFIADSDRSRIANMAYDVLASTAVLLFPRAFNILDHYRYFSQLLIAFRMMAQDLVAVMVLIVICCSGFFVAFTLSFSDDPTHGKNVAYALFQMVMGFTPAAWSSWNEYNTLGRIVLTLFLFICHFLIVTILVSVLSNSFTAVVQNANEEHQFLFAVNAISMVKSDALFSYIPPTNLLSWIISPLRFIVAFRHFVKLNRTIIKVTHFPILFSIFAYERLVWSRLIYEPTDLVERPIISKSQPAAFGPSQQQPPTTHARRLREPSVISYRKDQALDEVFRKPFRGSTLRTTAKGMEGNRSKPGDVVDTWMQNVGREGGASPPQEQPQSVLDRLESRRPPFRRGFTADGLRPGFREPSTATKSILSDPEDRVSTVRRPNRIDEEDLDMSLEDVRPNVPSDDGGEDGDDELMTHDEGDNATVEKSPQVPRWGLAEEADKENVFPRESSSSSDYFATPVAAALRREFPQKSGSAPSSAILRPHEPQRPARNERVVSTSTTIFQPQFEQAVSSSSEIPRVQVRPPKPSSARNANATPIGGSGNRGGKLQFQQDLRQRPQLASRHSHQPTTGMRGLAGLPFSRRNREPSFNTIALDLASDLGENRFGPSLVDIGGVGAMPASFSEQMFRERELARKLADERRKTEQADKEVLGRMMLTRMNTLELGFREVINAVREMRSEVSRTGTGSERGGFSSAGDRPGQTRGNSGHGTVVQNSNMNSATSSVSGVPQTPGRVTGSGRERKSPKKVRRPTALRYGTANAANQGPSYAAVASQQPKDDEVSASSQIDPKDTETRNMSPIIVKTMVEDLERRESQTRTSSSSQGREQELGRGQDEDEEVDGRPKRESVIYVGPPKKTDNAALAKDGKGGLEE